MAKISLTDLLGGSIAQINSNFTLIKNALNNRVLWRDNPTGEPNQMFTTLDMNNRRILNLPAPASDHEPVRRIDVATSVGDTAAAVASAASAAQSAALAAQAVIDGAASVNQFFTSAGSSLVGFIQAGVGAVSRNTQSKLRDTVSPRDFGALLDGVSDDAPGIQRAINFIQNTYNGGTVEFPSGCKPKLNSGLVIDTNKCGMKWNGAVVDWTGVPSGTIAFSVTQSEMDVNRRPALNRAHPIEGAVHVGPGKSTNCILVVLRDTSANQVIAGVIFRNGGCWGWAKGLVLGQGSFFTTFENWDWAAVVGTDMGTCIDIVAESNSGEKNMFINNRFGSADLYLQQGNGNADTHLVGCSFNFAKRMIYSNAGTINISNFHMEGKDDTDNWVYLYGSNSVIAFNQGVFTIGGAKSLKTVMYCDAGVTHGGIFFNQCAIADASDYSLEFISGTGRVQANQMACYSSGAQPVISRSMNALAWGDFESLNYTSEWIMSGATLPAVSTGYAKTGSNALKITGQPGTNNGAKALIPVKPGQMVSASLWASITGYTDGNFYVAWSFLDKGGNTVGATGAAANLTGNTAYTRIGFGNIPPAPPGAVSFVLGVSYFNVTTGLSYGYIDDVIVNIV